MILMIRKVTGKPVEMTIRTMCAWAGLHTSDRLLLEAVREVNEETSKTFVNLNPMTL